MDRKKEVVLCDERRVSVVWIDSMHKVQKQKQTLDLGTTTGEKRFSWNIRKSLCLWII